MSDENMFCTSDLLSECSAGCDEIRKRVSEYILSSSGWRAVFALGGEEDRGEEISDGDSILVALASASFFSFLGMEHPRIAVGSDTRPTGKALMSISLRILAALGAEVYPVGISSSPEIMAYSRKLDGFWYISASHNPVGHNGFKFGRDGGVLGGDEAEQVKAIFLSSVNEDGISRMKALSASVSDEAVSGIISKHDEVKKASLSCYTSFLFSAAGFDERNFTFPFSVAIDFNGSSRFRSADIDLLESHGAKLASINDTEIAHGIVPEGDNLEYVRSLLEREHRKDSSFIIGYTPDNDGDRGNLAYVGDDGHASILQAQEVFALIASVELADAHLKGKKNIAIAVNGPTSLAIDAIAKRFDASVFRADIGEANVVGLAERLRREGYHVPLCGEGSNGGTIIDPSKVRDPLSSVLSLSKIFLVDGLYRAITGKVEQPSIHGVLSSLPSYYTTPSFSSEAVMKVSSQDWFALKEAYEKILLSEIEDNMPKRTSSYEIRQYGGSDEKKGPGDYLSGGYKVLFLDGEGNSVSSIWLSRSRTEPVVRVMADVRDADMKEHERLLSWQRSIVARADETLPQL